MKSKKNLNQTEFETNRVKTNKTKVQCSTFKSTFFVSFWTVMGA